MALRRDYRGFFSAINQNADIFDDFWQRRTQTYLPHFKREFGKNRENCGVLARIVLSLTGMFPLAGSGKFSSILQPPQEALRGFLYGAGIKPSTRQPVAVVRHLFCRSKNIYGFTRRKSLRKTSALQSLGMRQSPRGESATEPTFTPSGKQERLNC